MLNKKKLFVTSALALTFAASSALAAVGADQAARLSKDLTPLGAEKAGAGVIPAWTGPLAVPAGFKAGQKYVDPFPAEKAKFVITAENVEQYKANLTDGQLAMFKKYPKTYRIPVFETHRTAGYPDEINKATAENAAKTKLVSGGNGMANYEQGIPFPIPADGLEVVWNHIVRYRGGSVSRVVGQVTPTPDGAYSLVKFQDEFTFKNKLADYNPATMKDNNILFYFKQDVISPARLAGNVLLVHETLDQVKEPRKAWIYNAGQRRVRRAPQVAYDGPGTASDGMRTSDNFDMYNGSPDRYNWKLIGKKEIYVPYNSYRLKNDKLKYDDIVKAGHINQDYTRYELHRVWQIEGTLKDGQRHIYAKRTMYIDEDSWQAVEIDHYDGRGQLWRVAEAHSMFFYDVKVPWYALETLYDLQSGRYLALGLDNEEPVSYNFGFERREADYTPNALRRDGVR